VRSFIREPLLHFLLAAAALLALDFWTRPLRKPVLEIQAAAVEAQSSMSAQRLGRPLTATERAAIADQLLEDEILFQEAQKRGMVTDNQVRSTLIAMMRSALKPVTAEPTDAELNATRSKLPRESTTLPQQISFEYVSYANAETIPADLLSKLRSGADPKSLGEPMQLANPLPPTYRPQVERLLGNEFTEKVFVQPLNEWQGPINSSRGVFFIRVIARQSEQPLALEAIKPILESHWMNQKQGDAVAREVDLLKANYRIVMPQPGADKEGGE
jgi:hypothetical protein